MTFFSKRVFPVLWFGFLAVFVLSAFSGMNSSGRLRFEFLLVPVFMAAVGYLVMKKLVFDLADEVWDAGTELVVKNKGQEERIPLEDIMNISYTVFTNPPRVTLTLRQPTLLGKEITFAPPSRLLPFSRSPIVDELIERVDAARRR